MTAPTTLRTELEELVKKDDGVLVTGYTNDSHPEQGRVSALSQEEFIDQLEALYTRKLAEAEKAARIDELQEYFDAIQQTPDDYARQRLAELKTGKEGERE